MKQQSRTKQSRRWGQSGWALLACLVLAGCSFDGSSLEERRCNSDTECEAAGDGYVCVNGYCQFEEVELCTSDAQCDDGAFCNGVETCAPASPGADELGCVTGQAPTLTDNIPCTEDRCDEESDQVVHDDSTCECATAGEACPGDAPACTRLVCNDLLQCETELLAVGVACDDGVACTQGDACDGAGTCEGTLSDDVCSDGLFCNGDEACDPGALDADAQGCVPGDPPALADDLECTTDLCNEDEDRVINDDSTCECQVPNTICEGMEAPSCMRWVCSDALTCELLPQAAGAACDDGFACTANDLCNAEGECRGSTNHVFCSDGLFCTGEESCQPQSPLANTDGCVQGVPPVVDDGLRCTEDACDDVNDVVTHEEIPACEELVCEQDSDCVPEEGANPCLDYICGPGQACTTQFKAAGVACDDGVACTDTDQCNGQGTCQGRANNALCDDGAFCDGAEICNPIDQRADADGCLAGEAPALDDGVDCTLDTCDEATDQVLHAPTEACECQADPDCEQTCAIAVCDRTTWTCDNRPAPQGTPCDDGDACTLGETCDEEQVCGGGAQGGCDCVQDSDCELSACQLSATCNAGTCIYENADMGTPCGTEAACDQSACNSEGACVPSLNDAACDSPGECRQGGTCQPGEGADAQGCVYDLAAPQTPCGTGLACDQSACNDAGVCVPDLNDGLCQVACRQDAACAPSQEGADGQGCVAGSISEDGESCSLTCGQDEVEGACQSGTCALAPEGPVVPGRDLCGDGLDNDCDGVADAQDSDCKVPGVVEVAAPDVAPVGLEGDGAQITVTTRVDGQPVTSQTRNLYCQARPLLWSRGFEAPLDTNVHNNNNLTADSAYAVRGGTDDEVDPGGDVSTNVLIDGGDLGQQRGVAVCNGYGLRVDPGINLSTSVIGAGRSVMMSVRMRNPDVDGLEAGQFAVLSYRARNSTGGDYVPLLAIGDGLDRELRSYEFAIYPTSNSGPLSIRVDVVNTDGTFAQDACVVVDQVQFFAIPRPPLLGNEDRQMATWSWGGQARDAQELFNVTSNPNGVNTDMLLGQFFSQRLPVEGHDLSLDAAGTPFTTGSGVTWAYGGALPGASVSLPAATPPEGVLGADAQPQARDAYRVNPLMMDFAMAVEGGQWSSGDLAHLTLALPGDALDLNALRRLASALPRDGMDPVGWVSHYDTSLPSQNRFYVVLPEEARPLTQRSLALAHGNLEGPDAQVLFDDVSLYSFTAVTAQDVRASVGEATDIGEDTYHATVHSAREGEVQVRCYWQDLDNPMTVTRASEPVIINFTSNQ